MNIATVSWLEYVQAMCDDAIRILARHGFSESDVDYLLSIAEEPDLDEDVELPPAFLTVLARIFKAGQLLIDGYDEKEMDLNCKTAYAIGRLNLEAGLFMRAPIFDATFAATERRITDLFEVIVLDANKEVFRLIKQKQGNARAAAEKREKIDERNAQLCQTAQRLRAENNAADHNLASNTKRAWDSSGIWGRHGYKEISIKQVRQILREGGVLPPAKTKKEK